MSRKGSRIKLIILVTLLLLAGFFATNYLNYVHTKEKIREELIYETMPLTRDNIYSELQRDIARPIFVSSLMAHDTFLKDWAIHGENGTDNITKYLSEIKKKYGFFSSFYVSARTKNYYHYRGILKKVDKKNIHDDWYFDFINSKNEHELNIDTNEAENNALTIFINHRLIDYNGDLLGVVGVGLNMERIVNLLSVYQAKYGRDIYLVNRIGIIQIHPDKNKMAQHNVFFRKGIADVAAQALKVSHYPTFFEFSEGNDRKLLTVRYIPELDWFLFVEQSENAILEGVKKSFTGSVAIGTSVTFIVAVILIWSLNLYHRRLIDMATTDELTGAYNRREFEKVFSRAASKTKKDDEKLSIILLDIDDFKTLNDNYGHIIGDSIIKKVVAVISKCIRRDDLLVRWGGDEFIVLTFSDIKAAVGVAERIRKEVEAINLEEDTVINSKITISSGVAEYAEGDNQDSLTQKADKALYKSKKDGRNRVSIET